MVRLGVNIDHVATVRQARRTNEPDPVWAAAMAQLGGADGITIHLREDRRHILDRDLTILRDTVTVKLNLECACVDSMIDIACQAKPEQVCLVPEKREEITTEGGLNLNERRDQVGSAIKRLQDVGIEVSLFIDPDVDQITISEQLGAERVELHTGSYANAVGASQLDQLRRLEQAAHAVSETSMQLDAGHGLTYHNVCPVADLPGLKELNIGHSIVSRSIFVGLQTAVREMKQLINSKC